MGRTATHILPNEREALDRAKVHIALVIRHSLATKTHLMQKHAARRLQTSSAQVSRIERGQIEGLSFNQLFRFLARLEPNFQILVAAEAPQAPSPEPPPDTTKTPDQGPQKPPN